MFVLHTAQNDVEELWWILTVAVRAWKSHMLWQDTPNNSHTHGGRAREKHLLIAYGFGIVYGYRTSFLQEIRCFPEPGIAGLPQFDVGNVCQVSKLY